MRSQSTFSAKKQIDERDANAKLLEHIGFYRGSHFHNAGAKKKLQLTAEQLARLQKRYVRGSARAPWHAKRVRVVAQAGLKQLAKSRTSLLDQEWENVSQLHPFSHREIHLSLQERGPHC